jgi:hypothetical protein
MRLTKEQWIALLAIVAFAVSAVAVVLAGLSYTEREGGTTPAPLPVSGSLTISRIEPLLFGFENAVIYSIEVSLTCSAPQLDLDNCWILARVGNHTALTQCYGTIRAGETRSWLLTRWFQSVPEGFVQRFCGPIVAENSTFAIGVEVRWGEGDVSKLLRGGGTLTAEASENFRWPQIL